MKVIKYRFLSAEINHGTEEKPVLEQVFFDKVLPWSGPNEEVARLEAYNGEYKIADAEEGPGEPTQEERIAELEEALELLLAGVTE